MDPEVGGPAAAAPTSYGTPPAAPTGPVGPGYPPPGYPPGRSPHGSPHGRHGGRGRGVVDLLTRRPAVTYAIAGGLAVVLLTYLVPSMAAAGELPRGTRIAGVDVGGLEPAAAEATLRRELADDVTRPLTVEAGGRRLPVDPVKAGLSVDWRATVDSVDRGFPSPVALARRLFGGGQDVAPVVRMDAAKMNAVVAALAKAVDRPKREASIRYAGLRPVATLPRSGRVVDRPAAANAIRAAFPRLGAAAEQGVPLPVATDAPSVTAAQVRRFAATDARTAVAGPVTLTNGARRADLGREALAANLVFAADGRGGLRPRFNAGRAVAPVESRLIDQAKAPRDATYKLVNNRPRLVPARIGEGVDTAKLATSVAEVITASGGRTVPIQVKVTKPRVTTTEARKLGIKEKISSFTTRHPCCAPRVTNIHRMAEIVNGHLVKPGETFSLNGVVGQRDRARGFVEAPMILNGRFVDDVGGGVSQFATTMFNAVFFGGLADVQHTPHQFYISRYPAGRESTVSYPQPDFRWKNDSPYGVLVQTSYTDTSITVTFWSTKRYSIESKSSAPYDVKNFKTQTDSGKDCIPMEGAKGFTIDVWRIFKSDGAVVRRQQFHTVYQPEPKLTCEKSGGS
jgi:vancomycin resistance protein YoaR